MAQCLHASFLPAAVQTQLYAGWSESSTCFPLAPWRLENAKRCRMHMKVEKNISLLPYNTFGIDAKADLFIEYYSLDELRQVLKEHKGERILHIGQGSNLLFTRDFNGIILHSGMARARFLDDETVEAQNGLRLDDPPAWATKQVKRINVMLISRFILGRVSCEYL